MDFLKRWPSKQGHGIGWSTSYRKNRVRHEMQLCGISLNKKALGVRVVCSEVQLASVNVLNESYWHDV